jgi:hypothetical protein
MAVGQQALGRVLDVGRIGVLEVRLRVREVERRAAHSPLLRDVLALHELYSRESFGMSTVSQLALVLQCSEFRANELLGTAVVLDTLPGGFEALECGLLGIEQSAVVFRQLAPLDLPARLGVWARLQEQLLADDEAGAVRPAARLRELLSGWVIEADPAGAVARRKDAAAEGDVDYRRRDDGLVDLAAYGLTGPDAHACLAKIRACAAPVGLGDERLAGKRRVDALVDLILGRNPLPFTPDDDNPPDDAAEPGRCAAAGGGGSCGCRPGQPVPCGAQLTVLVPLGAALGTSDEPAELVGHGPLEPDLLAELLAAGPALRAAWLDDQGVPVSVSTKVQRPGRGDPEAVRQALLRIAVEPPGPPHPRHPDDHRSPIEPPPPDEDPPRLDDVPPGRQSPPGRVPAGRVSDRPRLRERAHPAGTPGPYRVPTRLRRLLTLRSPRCEWPGCGCAATGCDQDHDLAHPYGPTCACQLGPLCRRHHRVKQAIMSKQRTRDAGVRWTSPTGRTWLSPPQHQPPLPPTRPLPALPVPDPLDQLGPAAREDEQWHTDPTNPAWDDPDGLELRVVDVDPPPYREPEPPSRATSRWTLDLDDPYAWLPVIWSTSD